MSDLVLVAGGSTYSIVLAVEENDLDWLDNAILEVCAKARRVDDLIRAFDLPRRIMDDALARLIEQHLLLLDVSLGTVKATNLPPRFPANSSGETVKVWQDDASGTIVPWEMVKAWAAKAPAAERVQGAPGATDGTRRHVLDATAIRSVMQMSEAELLVHLEAFRRDTAWSQRVRSVKRDGPAVLNIPARRREDGRVLAMAPYLPALLIRRWERLDVSAGADVRAAARSPLPDSWSELIGRWSMRARERVQLLARGQPLLTDAADPPDEAVREVLERSATITWLADPQELIRTVFGVDTLDRTVTVAVSNRFVPYGQAKDLLTRLGGGGDRLVLAPQAWKPNQGQRDRAREARIRLGAYARGDQDFAIVDDRAVVFGALGSWGGAVVRWRRPLLPYLAWIEEMCGRQHGAVAHNEPPDEVDLLVARLRNFETSLAEYERMPPPAPAAPGQPEVRSGAPRRLEVERAEIEAALHGMRPVPTAALEAEQLIELLRTTERKVRVLVRAPDSPLVSWARLCKQLEAIIVWAAGEVAVARPLRRLGQAGPMEAVLIGDDVAVIGCWVDTATTGMPPLLAVRDRAFVDALTKATDAAKLPST